MDKQIEYILDPLTKKDYYEQVRNRGH